MKFSALFCMFLFIKTIKKSSILQQKHRTREQVKMATNHHVNQNKFHKWSVAFFISCTILDKNFVNSEIYFNSSSYSSSSSSSDSSKSESSRKSRDDITGNELFTAMQRLPRLLTFKTLDEDLKVFSFCDSFKCSN